MKYVRIIVFALIGMFAGTAFAMESQPTANTMNTVREAVKAQKRAFVAMNMQLTAEEEGKFWPIYDAYQKDLLDLHKNLASIISEYAGEYNANTLSDEKAQDLAKRTLAYQENLTKLNRAYLQKLLGNLSAKKAVRYLQLENKMNAVIQYDMADNIPLVQ